MDRPDPSAIPTTPGVYLYKDARGRIIYIGKAINLRRRVLSYFRPIEQQTPKTAAMLSHVFSLETLSTNTEKEALLLEASLIKKHRPRYNIILRDDKQYVLFRLSQKDDFPRLVITRKVNRQDGARYFGPFTSGMSARETWKTIHRIFPLRRCNDRAMRNRIRPCLYFDMNLCLAPCTSQVTQNDYRKMIDRVELLLAGKSKELLELLRDGMQQASAGLDFEKAAALRDQIRAIEKTIERQGVVLPHGGDLDVLGLVIRPDGLALGVVFVRDGMAVDRNTFFWPSLGLEEATELIWSFLGQFYGANSSIPPRIIIPWETGDADLDDSQEHRAVHLTMEAALSAMRGSPVHITTPRNPEEHRLVDMAKSNAREASRNRSDIPLGERLALVLESSLPVERIECVDVSHTGGAATKVGLIVYEGGKPLKDDYRVWNIDGAKGDDYAALNEWAVRRLERGAPWPDLMLVDGGKGQLAVVHKVLSAGLAESEPVLSPGKVRELPFVLASIAKARDEAGRADRRAGNLADRIFLPGRGNPLNIREGSPELLFLQSVRDAAHDFAIGRHRQARAKQAFSGELQRLPGIGPHIARLLWDNFMSIDEMRAASKDDLTKLPGVGPKKAEAIWVSLQKL